MAAKKTVVYDCNVCGTEVTVNSEGVSNLSPIYCCGISLSKRTKKKPAKKSGARGKTASNTTAKKTAKKSVFLTLDEEKKNILSQTIKNTINELDEDGKRKLMIIVPDNAKKYLKF